MPTAIVVNNELLKTATPHKVYMRQWWGNDWEEVPYLACDWLVLTAAPSIGSAGFSWRYGHGMRQFERQFGQVARRDDMRVWVKVVVGEEEDLEQIIWHGSISEEGRRIDGAFVGETPARVESGEQAMVAFGLEEIFNRQKITTAWWLDTSGDKETDARLGRGLTFNRSNQGKDKGNRTHDKGPQDCHLFTGNVTDESLCEYWSTVDIVQYLLMYHKPESSDGFFCDIPMEVDEDALNNKVLPDWDQPIIATHGRTVKSVLDEVLDRRRLFSYTFEVVEDEDEGQDKIVLRPFTFLDENLVLRSGKALVANSEQITVDFDKQKDLDTAVVQRSAGQQYDQVIATGDRVLCCARFGYNDQTLEAGWSGVQRNLYEQGASLATAYATAPVDKQQAMNHQARAADALVRVFSYFNLPDDWDGKVKGLSLRKELFPWDEFPDLDPDIDSVWYPPEVRFERRLPLKTDHHYEDDKIADEEVEDKTPEGRQWEYRRPYVVILCPDMGLTHYCEIERMAGPGDVEMKGSGAGRNWCGSVRIQEEGPGIVIRTSGAPEYVLAGPGGFTALPVDEYFGGFDWHYMYATLAMYADHRVEKKYPETIEGTYDITRILRIDASRQAKLEWVAEGTIVGVSKDGFLQYVDKGAFLRDDREFLEDLAKLAHEWYGTFRQTITLSYRQAVPDFHLGDLITRIGYADTLEPIRTVITEIRVDLATSQEETHRTTIKTHWAELDPLVLLPGPKEDH